MSNENAPPTKMTISFLAAYNFIFAIASYCTVSIPQATDTPLIRNDH